MNVDPTPDVAQFDRRSVLRVGGLTVALGAVLSACGAGKNGGNEGVGPEGISQLGTAPPLAAAPSDEITDTRLLRTAASMHYNGIDAIDKALTVPGLNADVAAVAKAYRGLLQQQADAINGAVSDLGGTPFTEKNAVIDQNIVAKGIELIGKSETPADDAARFLHAFATLAAETHQAFIPLFAAPAVRGVAMGLGTVHHRASALLASLISPSNIVTPDAIAAAKPGTIIETPVESGDGPAPVAVYQIPSAFGPLGAVQIVLGQPGVDNEFKRQQLNLETPSLNSLVAPEGE